MNGRRLGAMPKQNTETKRKTALWKSIFTINSKRNMNDDDL